MGRIVVTEFISLDGVVEDPGGSEDYAHGSWAFSFDRGEDGDRFKLDELEAADAMLLGRVTYEGFAAAWPNYPANPFTDKMNSVAKYVVSSTLQSADWNNSTILLRRPGRGDHGAQAAHRRRHPRRRQRRPWRGCSIANDLVDEYRLMVFPVDPRLRQAAVGRRRPRGPGALTLDSAERAGDVQLLVLHPKR